MFSERDYYENPALWLPEKYGGVQAERTEETISWIPSETRSILDAGCGNGVLTNRLGNVPTVVGIDRSFAALKWVQRAPCQGDLAALPFLDNTFDLTVSTEVLEHLPTELLNQALSEMARVTTKYLLISVPYCENLALRMVTCPRCKTEFHRYYHMRSFGKTDLKSLFLAHGFALRDAAGIMQTRVSGATRVTELRATLLQKLKMRKTYFDANTICPECAYTISTKQSAVDFVNGNSSRGMREQASVDKQLRTERSRLYHAVDKVVPATQSYRWWLALYERTGL